MNNRQEQIEQAKRLIATGISEELVEVLHQQFPELKESEDERIRKGLENFLWCIANGGMNDRGTMPSAEKCQKWLAYLEKQKEIDSTPLDWNDYKDKPVEVWNAYIRGKAVGIEIGKQKEQQPAEWSGEDDKRVAELKTFIAQCNGFSKANRQKAFELIDALRPQPHWKPSEEQMKALNEVANDGVLLDLFNDLLKLL